jgi:alpha-tubulin suppressor-like RCC1 family protein
VSCGFNHTAAVKTDGSLWLWGQNTNGQLANNTAANRSTPVTTFAGGNDWKQVSCGSLHTAAVKTDGTLWLWGSNAIGQLGQPSPQPNRSTPITTFGGGNNWRQVSCGYYHTTAIKTDGTLWGWGLNGSGQLGTNTVSNALTPVTTFAGGNNWKQISCGGNSTAAIKTDGTLWIWGFNNFGQLGINNTTLRLTPVTTFIGGNNWKSVSFNDNATVFAIRSYED